MKKLIPFFIALISSHSWAWTLVYSGAEGFPTNEITINVAATNSCANAGLTASSLLTQLETSIDKFWNQVSESALVLKIGELKSIDINGDSFSGSTLNLYLCSSYYFKVDGSWSVNDNSGCGNLVYSGGYAQGVSLLFQSAADELGVLRTDIMNDV